MNQDSQCYYKYKTDTNHTHTKIYILFYYSQLVVCYPFYTEHTRTFENLNTACKTLFSFLSSLIQLINTVLETYYKYSHVYNVLL